jgi:hypothetical protein
MTSFKKFKRLLSTGATENKGYFITYRAIWRVVFTYFKFKTTKMGDIRGAEKAIKAGRNFVVAEIVDAAWINSRYDFPYYQPGEKFAVLNSYLPGIGGGAEHFKDVFFALDEAVKELQERLRYEAGSFRSLDQKQDGNATRRELLMRNVDYFETLDIAEEIKSDLVSLWPLSYVSPFTGKKM